MTVARHAAWALLLIPGCFHPNYDHPHCGPNRECPSGLTCSAQLVCENGKIDASIDTFSSGIDAQACFGTGIVKVCLATTPTQPLTISSAITIDTSTSSLCAPNVSSGSDYCVIAATSIDVTATLRATGARPLVLIASDSITTTAGGSIDVGSHRGAIPETGAGADPTFCAAGTPPASSAGGAGGSFMGPGGRGGTGGVGPGGVPAPAVSNPTELRGGCAAQAGNGSDSGAGGHGGGAVFLIAGNSIGVGGSINAAGEGGAPGLKNSSGAGGGGAGGMIGFDAPMITGSGLILANGGGGGEGSTGGGIPGAPGADPIAITAAPGGSGSSGGGGDGGNGSAGAAAGAGDPGFAGSGGGGGGGGGAGLIKAPAGAKLGTQVSPAPTP